MPKTPEGRELTQKLPKGKVQPSDKKESPGSIAQLIKPKLVEIRNRNDGGIPVPTYQNMAAQMDPVSKAGLKIAAQQVLSPDKFKELMAGGANKGPSKAQLAKKGAPPKVATKDAAKDTGGAAGGKEAKGPAGPKGGDEPAGPAAADAKKAQTKANDAKAATDKAKSKADAADKKGAAPGDKKKNADADAKGGDEAGGDKKGADKKAADKAKGKGEAKAKPKGGGNKGGKAAFPAQSKVPQPKSEREQIAAELSYNRQWQNQLKGGPGAGGVMDRASLLAQVGGPAALQGFIPGLVQGGIGALTGHLVDSLGKGMGVPGLGNVIGGVRSAINLYQSGGRTFMWGYEAIADSVKAFKEGRWLTGLADLCYGLAKWVGLIGQVASVVSGAAYILSGASFLLGLIPGCQALLALTGPLANIGRIAGLISSACGPVGSLLNGCAMLFRALSVLAGEGSAEDISTNLAKFNVETRIFASGVGSAVGAKFVKNQIEGREYRQQQQKTDVKVPQHSLDKAGGAKAGGASTTKGAPAPKTESKTPVATEPPKGGGYLDAVKATFGFADGKYTPLENLREARRTAQGKGEVDYTAAVKRYKQTMRPDKKDPLLSNRENAKLYADMMSKHGKWAKMSAEQKSGVSSLKNAEAQQYRKWAALSDRQKDNVRNLAAGKNNLQAGWRKQMAERMKSDKDFEKRMDSFASAKQNDPQFRKKPEDWTREHKSDWEFAGKRDKAAGDDTLAGQGIRLIAEGPGVLAQKKVFKSREDAYEESLNKYDLGEERKKAKEKPVDGHTVYGWIRGGLGGSVFGYNKLIHKGIGSAVDSALPGRKKLMRKLPSPPAPTDKKFKDLLAETDFLKTSIQEIEGSMGMLKGGMDANAANTKIAQEHKKSGKALQDVGKAYTAASKQHQKVAKHRAKITKSGIKKTQQAASKQGTGSQKVSSKLGPVIGVIRRVHSVVGGMNRLPGVNVSRFHNNLGNMIKGYDAMTKGKAESKKSADSQKKKFEQNLAVLNKAESKSKVNEQSLKKTEGKLAKQQELLAQYIKMTAESKKKMQQRMRMAEDKRTKLSADYQQKYAKLRGWAAQHYSARMTHPVLDTMPASDLDWYDQNRHH